MESITLNITYKTNKSPKGSDIASFRLLKKEDPEIQDDRYILVCFNNDLEPLQGPEVYKKQGKGVDYLVGTNKYYNEEALPLIVVSDESQCKEITEGELKGSVAILNKGPEPPYINLEDVLYLNLIFDKEGKTITFDKSKLSKLSISTSMAVKDDFYTDLSINPDKNGRSEEVLAVNDVLEEALSTMNYFETFKKISRTLGQWQNTGRRRA